MSRPTDPNCAACQNRVCREGHDCFRTADAHRAMYADPQIAALHKGAAAIEARHYCQEPRIREIMLFAKELGIRKLGLAFCVGLAEEAKIVQEILQTEFEIASVCCKLCGIPKKELGMEQIHPEKALEVMCNPAGQAERLNAAGTGLNVLCGLCVGHDAIFSKCSDAPVTTLIAKDRVLAHNPAGALYSRYIRRTLRPEEA